MNTMTSGIYKIYCRDTNKYYIGQSMNVKNRLRQHLSELKNNKHINKSLQSDFNICGEDAFVFEKIKDVEEEFLNIFEKYYMEYYNSVEDGYNIVTINNLVRNKSDDSNIDILEDIKPIETPLFMGDVIAFEMLNYALDACRSIKDGVASAYLKEDIYKINNFLEKEHKNIENKILDTIELSIRRRFNKLRISNVKYCKNYTKKSEKLKEMIDTRIIGVKVVIDKKEMDVPIRCAK